jgi:[ribosomal protein S5]-alanine N-acetyltransferase
MVTAADIPDIRTERLTLVSVGAPLMWAWIEGDRVRAAELAAYETPPDWPDEGVVPFLRLRHGQQVEHPEFQQWQVRALVRNGKMIGYAGFHDPPRERGELEMGYTIFPEHRRQGYAVEAALGLMDWAEQEHGIKRFVLSISPTNEPSLSIARKLGFQPTGVQWDEEDGEELIFELEKAD